MNSTGLSRLRALAAFLVVLPMGSANSLENKIEVPPLKPIKSVIPVYPEALKEEGIAGEVAIWAGIDVEGNVRRPVVIRHLHPELDALALKAVQQWKFEPFVHRGEAVQFLTYISVLFEPGEPAAVEDPSPERPMSDTLRRILDRCAEYALKLNAAARFYVCRERIAGAVKNIAEQSYASIASFPHEGFAAYADYPFPMLEGSARVSAVNDYQAVNKGGRFAERRIPISANRSAMKEKGRLGIESFLPPLAPVAVPARLLAPGFRPEFTYSIAPDDEVRRRRCSVIEIKPKRKRTSEILSATVWADEESCRILRVEVEWAAGSLNEQILSECRRYHLTPHLSVLHDFEIEKNGLLYPSRSEVGIGYSGLVRPREDTKAALGIRYDQYKFFSVESEPKIIR
jgi:protein TonB